MRCSNGKYTLDKVPLHRVKTHYYMYIHTMRSILHRGESVYVQIYFFLFTFFFGQNCTTALDTKEEGRETERKPVVQYKANITCK